MKKICNKCKMEKDVCEFYKRKNRGNGLAAYYYKCRTCSASRKNVKGVGTFDKKEYMKNYRIKNSEKLNLYLKEYRDNNQDRIQTLRKNYYENNKEHVKKKSYNYVKYKGKTDPLFKLTRNIRSLINISFRSKFTTKSKRTIEILGCSFEEFYKHLESKFDDKMNWENQGTYWHMDHIIPISSAKTEDEVYKLNHYTNFQPLYWEDNLKKSNKY